LLYGIDFDQVSQTNFFAPDKVTETAVEVIVALAAAVTVNVFASAAVATVKEPSVAEPVV
jgi:hypothetical protein